MPRKLGRVARCVKREYARNMRVSIEYCVV